MLNTEHREDGVEVEEQYSSKTLPPPRSSYMLRELLGNSQLRFDHPPPSQSSPITVFEERQNKPHQEELWKQHVHHRGFIPTDTATPKETCRLDLRTSLDSIPPQKPPGRPPPSPPTFSARCDAARCDAPRLPASRVAQASAPRSWTWSVGSSPSCGTSSRRRRSGEDAPGGEDVCLYLFEEVTGRTRRAVAKPSSMGLA